MCRWLGTQAHLELTQAQKDSNIFYKSSLLTLQSPGYQGHEHK